jgi:hypothetical protein
MEQGACVGDMFNKNIYILMYVQIFKKGGLKCRFSKNWYQKWVGNVGLSQIRHQKNSCVEAGIENWLCSTQDLKVWSLL